MLLTPGVLIFSSQNKRRIDTEDNQAIVISEKRNTTKKTMEYGEQLQSLSSTVKSNIHKGAITFSLHVIKSARPCQKQLTALQHLNRQMGFLQAIKDSFEGLLIPR